MTTTAEGPTFVEHVTHDLDAPCLVGADDKVSAVHSDVTCPQCISLRGGAHDCGFTTTSRIGMYDGSTLVACPCGRRWTEWKR